MTASWRALALVLLAGAGCARSESSVELMAPFSDDTKVGQLTARWMASGEERTNAGVTERAVIVRIDAVNRLADRLYLRLRGLRLLGPSGPLPAGAAGVGCTLAPGLTRAVLSGRVWVAAAEANAIRGVHVEHFAVPLSERGRAFYREFLLRQRPAATAAAVDAELDAYAAAPPCHAAE